VGFEVTVLHVPSPPIKGQGTWSNLPNMDSENLMDILYLLIPLSVILVFFILGGLWWAIYRGQFEDIESEGERILKDS